MIKKIAILLLAGAALASCDPTEAEVRRVQGNLPEGCKVYSLGEYGSIRQLVMVRCANSQTTTSGYEQHGKHHFDYAVSVNG